MDRHPSISIHVFSIIIRERSQSPTNQAPNTTKRQRIVIQKMENVPVLDLSLDRATVVQTMDQALRQFGFFYVRGHGVDPALVQGQWEAAKALFALPLQEKISMPFDPQLDIGYVGQGVQSLDPDGTVQHAGDTKEQFMMTNNQLMTDPTSSTDPTKVFHGSHNYKPNVPGYDDAMEAYASALFRLDQQLNSILFEALQLDQETQTALGKEPFVVLKQMRYAGDPSDPEKGKFGAGAHCDWGAFTILWTDDTPGLEILFDGQWLPVPPKPDCFIINSGDQIAQLTNNHYKSAMHRVVTRSSKPRFSTAFFTYFGIQANVGPLAKFVSTAQKAAYPHRTTLDYFHFKLHESMGVEVRGK